MNPLDEKGNFISSENRKYAKRDKEAIKYYVKFIDLKIS